MAEANSFDPVKAEEHLRTPRVGLGFRV
ncbi:LOW QUALITY PROTEIN: hypothetical protein ENH_00033470 [Eimeria necatrix]|uniref:Uncharacterized protein n=1 Tax=Eimeria necatrix TaxID=51315 RepID=U6MTB8_9EIME|nr:LOW QUALITY PROTEIN: hypothetical protein ENH_00033470 [Eimeria necatrix]CDJ67261.1 hypothetical protein ENH_00033470 [Eimeria necatrix]